jgi:two-component system, NtrC family, sensor kinase
VRLWLRLVLLIAVAALAPLVVLGLGAAQISTRAVVERVSEMQGRTATGLAESVDLWTRERVDQLARQATSFHVDALDDAGRTQFLRLLYRQTEDARMVLLVDRRGLDLSPAVYLEQAGVGDLQGREAVGGEDLAAFRKAIPVAAALAAGPGRVVLGAPYQPDGRAVPVLPLAMALPGRGEAVLALEVGLDELQSELLRSRPGDYELALLDAEGRRVLGTGAALVEPEVFSALLGSSADDVRYTTAAGVDVLAACVAVPSSGWLLVLAEPLASSLRPAEEIQLRTAFIAGLSAVLSVVLGVMMARRVSRPVVRLRDASLAVAEGDFGHRVEVAGRDELAELMRAFNFMSGRLEQDQEQIAAQKKEIEAFNAELQDRVEERTRQLQSAQKQLVQSARLAAVGEMGSGLAHELNNPIAGILGLVQVLRAGKPAPEQDAFLAPIEDQARRCKEIVAQMLLFSRDAPAGGAVDRADWDVVDLGGVLTDVLALVGGPLRQRGVQVVHAPESGIRIRADASALGRAFAQLLTSVRSSAQAGATLRVQARSEQGRARIDLELSPYAPGLGDDDRLAAGMAFWAARRVFAEHGGELLEPELHANADRVCWSVLLPEA